MLSEIACPDLSGKSRFAGKIVIIGAGNVGGALALGCAKAGHEVILGAKDPNSDKVKKVTS